MGTKVTNVSNGPRGIRNADGQVVMIEVDETAEIDLAKGEEAGDYFKFGAAAAKAAKADDKD